MPTFFFVLLRFYLRVDGVLCRIIDTRLFGDRAQPEILREFSVREANLKELKVSREEKAVGVNARWF